MPIRLGLSLCMACVALSFDAQSAGPAKIEGLINSGSSLIEKSDYVHAIPLLRQATEIAPHDAQANRLLGAALLQSGNPAAAVPPLRIAAAATPADESAEGYLGDAEIEIGKFSDAAQTFQEAVTRSPTSEQVLVWWTGFCLERYRRLSFSLRETSRGRAELLRMSAANDKIEPKSRKLWLSQAAAIDPGLPDVWGELGIVEMMLSESADAETSLNHALQSSPRSLPTLELQALVDASHEEWNGAERKLLEIEQRSRFEAAKIFAAWPRTLLPPDNFQATIWQCLREASGNCSLKIPQTNPDTSPSVDQLFAENRWEQLTALPDPDPEADKQWFWKGLAFAMLGDCHRAIPALERGLPAGAEASAARLVGCYQEQAVVTADKLQGQGREAAVHQIRGDILLSIRLDAAEALKEYDAALRLDPKNPQILEKSAEARYSQGDMKGAETDAQAALALSPSRIQLMRLLIRIAMSEREYGTVLTYVERLTQIDPTDNWAQAQQGMAYAASGRAEEASQHLKAALDANYPDEKGVLHAMLAAQLRKLGRDREAKIASEEAIRLADSFQEQNHHPNIAPE